MTFIFPPFIFCSTTPAGRSICITQQHPVSQPCRSMGKEHSPKRPKKSLPSHPKLEADLSFHSLSTIEHRKWRFSFYFALCLFRSSALPTCLDWLSIVLFLFLFIHTYHLRFHFHFHFICPILQHLSHFHILLLFPSAQRVSSGYFLFLLRVHVILLSLAPCEFTCNGHDSQFLLLLACMVVEVVPWCLA